MPDVLDLLFPRICPGCGMPLRKKEKIICLFCLLKLPRTSFIGHSDNAMEKLFRGRIQIGEANAFLYFTKSGLSQRLMHALKYGGNRALGIYLGKLFAGELLKSETFEKPDVLIAVPLHKEKWLKRGYNQSEQIAIGMSEKLGVTYRNDVLVRARNTETQTRKKRFERWENIQDVFAVEQGLLKPGTKVGLIDDVVTTGATLEACAMVLKEKIGAEVSLYTLCMAIR